jgi:hypothetical protein
VNDITRASLRLMALARPATGDPVADTERAAAMTAARAAVCIAAGVAIEDISADGYDHSAAAYADVRAGWVRHIAQWGITLFDCKVDEAFALWQEARPGLAAGDDWRAAGMAAHRAACPDGSGCFYGEDCVICHAGDWS